MACSLFEIKRGLKCIQGLKFPLNFSSVHYTEMHFYLILSDDKLPEDRLIRLGRYSGFYYVKKTWEVAYWTFDLNIKSQSFWFFDIKKEDLLKQ